MSSRCQNSEAMVSHVGKLTLGSWIYICPPRRHKANLLISLDPDTFKLKNGKETNGQETHVLSRAWICLFDVFFLRIVPMVKHHLWPPSSTIGKHDVLFFSNHQTSKSKSWKELCLLFSGRQNGGGSRIFAGHDKTLLAWGFPVACGPGFWHPMAFKKGYSTTSRPQCLWRNCSKF